MDGPDLPSGGSGAPPGSPAQSRKRKRGATPAAEEPAAASTRRATRSTAGLEVGGAVRWARSAAAGTLWAVRGRNRGIDDDEERMGALILAVRHVLSELKPDDPDTPYAKKRLHRQGTRSSARIAGHLSSFLVSTRKCIRIDSVQYQASVPEWENAPSEKDKADYRTDKKTLQKMGTVVMLPFIMEPRKTRQAVDDKCKCSRPGSEACVGVHVKETRNRLKYQLGEKTFKNCGFDAMGEEVLKLWTAEDKKKLDDIEKLIPHNKHENFMKIASKQFSSKKTTDLAKYYYNIFLPKRLAALTRTEATDATDASTDDEGNNQHDDNN
ncbi:AT-rich interactive domain-containing protein 1-like [Phragmites australis]|uniref:AT-rich interactive domain-containing protein 1-like n=1 Tax=Phragmites australis TaxID=29695 RepID=UPI002D7822E0|nr:AT-rich interactive domain-containing protein 1-like [Phragmites australis]